MLSHEFARNALIAGSAIAIASGVVGYFLVLRAQVFAGDALSHVAFTGTLAAALAGVDLRIGLFAATVAVGPALRPDRGACAGSTTSRSASCSSGCSASASSSSISSTAARAARTV